MQPDSYHSSIRRWSEIRTPHCFEWESMQQLGSVLTPSITTSLSTCYHPLTYSPTFTLQAVVRLTQTIPLQVFLTQSSSTRQGHEKWAGTALGTSMLSQQSCCHHSLKDFSALELKKKSFIERKAFLLERFKSGSMLEHAIILHVPEIKESQPDASL